MNAQQIAQMKESTKELKQMVEQDEAKKMGYGEYNVYKKLRTTLRRRGKHSDEVAKKLKTVMKNGNHDGDSKDSKGDHSDDEEHHDKKDKKKKD